MKEILKILFFISFSLSTAKGISQEVINIKYIANEGFLIESNNKKILFDGLFGGFEATWCDVPLPETKFKLEYSEPPFDNIDIIFISHKHSDHFNADMVVNHSLSNHNCKIICPIQVQESLSNHSNYEQIKKNVIAFSPDLSKDTLFIIDDMKVKIYRLEHSPYYEKNTITGEKINRHQSIENLGFLVDIGGIRLFHCGDANPWNEKEFQNLNLEQDSIDIAFLERLFFINNKGIEVIKNNIKPKKIVLMHIAPNNQEKYKMVLKELGDNFLDVYMFEELMDNRSFSINEF